MQLENLVFVNINTSYLKALHDVDCEVQYSSVGYEEKPFVGILILGNNIQYVVPLSSAKRKHLLWKDKYSDGRYLLTEEIKRDSITPNTIYQEIEKEDVVKRIYAALDVKKMIPVCEGLYSVVSFDILESDSKEITDYKILQEKEYRACVKIFHDVANKAGEIYEKQIRTGKIQRFCCNFALLENTMKGYMKQDN